MKYVPIKDRAFIETSSCTGFPSGLHRLYVLIDDSGVVRKVLTCKGKPVREVTHIRKAIRVACANMRERCAAKTYAQAVKHLSLTLSLRDAHLIAGRIAADLRGLEL